MRYLVLAEATLRQPEVLDRFVALNASAAAFHVVVPLRELTDAEQDYVSTEAASTVAGESPAQVMAQFRLEDAISALHKVGIDDVTGAVGVASCVDAVEQALEQERYDAVVVVSGPLGVRGWVHLDLPSRIERHVDHPVIHIEAHPHPSGV